MPALQGSEPEGLTSEEVSYIGNGRVGPHPGLLCLVCVVSTIDGASVRMVPLG